jgi:MFS family permease
MIGFMGLIGVETLIPLYMQNMRGFTAMESGIAILPGALVMGIMSPITGRVFDRFGARWLAITGLSIITITTFAFSSLDTSTSMAYIMILYSVRMFGLSMVMMPATTAGLNELPKRLLPHGTAMGNTMRQVAASIGTAVIVTVMTTAGSAAAQRPDVANPMIHGVNVAFMAITVLSLVGVVLSLFIRKTGLPSEKNKYKMSNQHKKLQRGQGTRV